VAEPVQTHAPEAEVALLRTLVEEMRATIADLRRREDDLKADRPLARRAQCYAAAVAQADAGGRTAHARVVVAQAGGMKA
jgi:hypothetical protein